MRMLDSLRTLFSGRQRARDAVEAAEWSEELVLQAAAGLIDPETGLYRLS